jgi:hypothetical protein
MSGLMDKAMRDENASLYEEARDRYVANEISRSNDSFTVKKEAICQARDRIMWALSKLVDTAQQLTHEIDRKEVNRDMIRAHVSFEQALRDMTEAYKYACGDYDKEL